MHSNGGCGFVSKAISPVVDEGRRGRAAAALARRRSYTDSGLIAGASSERLRTVSVMGVSKLGGRSRRLRLVASARSVAAQRNYGRVGGTRTHRTAQLSPALGPD